MSEVERAIYDMVRSRRLLAPTAQEIVRALKGAFPRAEIDAAIRSLLRASLLQSDSGTYRTEWWHGD